MIYTLSNSSNLNFNEMWSTIIKIILKRDLQRIDKRIEIGFEFVLGQIRGVPIRILS